jgi:hypothetical protein
VFIVKERIYRKAADGRTVLAYTPGTKLNDEEARRAGLIAGAISEPESHRGLTILSERDPDPQDPEPAPKLERLKLADLQAVCHAEDIDPGEANTRAEYISAIEDARASREA